MYKKYSWNHLRRQREKDGRIDGRTDWKIVKTAANHLQISCIKTLKTVWMNKFMNEVIGWIEFPLIYKQNHHHRHHQRHHLLPPSTPNHHHHTRWFTWFFSVMSLNYVWNRGCRFLHKFFLIHQLTPQLHNQ